MISAKNPTVSVVVPTYRRQERLQILINRLGRMKAAEKIDLIIVDQSESQLPELDNSSTSIFAQFSSLQLTSPNVSAARNRGAQLSSADLILFLDDDIEPNIDFIPILLSIFSSETSIACGPAANTELPRRPNSATQYLPVFLPTGALAIRRQHFFDVGGFDENLYRLFEDAEFSHRLKKAGFLLISDSRLKITHHDTRENGTWYVPNLREAAASHLENSLYFKKRIGIGGAKLLSQVFSEISREAMHGNRLRCGTPLTRSLALLSALPTAIRYAHKRPATISSAKSPRLQRPLAP